MIYKGVVKTFFVILCLLFPVYSFAGNVGDITADAYLLVEKDSFAVVAGKNYHTPLPPASTTKVMTTLIALERLDEEDTIVPTKKVLSTTRLEDVPCPGPALQGDRPYHRCNGRVSERRGICFGGRHRG